MGQGPHYDDHQFEWWKAGRITMGKLRRLPVQPRPSLSRYPGVSPIAAYAALGEARSAGVGDQETW